MPAASTTVINEVARRLRDVANFAYPRVQLVRLVDNAQRVLNARFKWIIANAVIDSVSYKPYSPLYRQATFVAPLGVNGVASIERVVYFNTVFISGRALDRVPWRTLVHQDPKWLVSTGRRPILWSTIGKDFLVLYPRIPGGIATDSFVVTYIPAQPSIILDNGSIDIVIPNESIPALRDLVESLALFKGRRFGEATDPVTRVRQSLAALEEARRLKVEHGQV